MPGPWAHWPAGESASESGPWVVLGRATWQSLGLRLPGSHESAPWESPWTDRDYPGLAFKFCVPAARYHRQVRHGLSCSAGHDAAAASSELAGCRDRHGDSDYWYY